MFAGTKNFRLGTLNCLYLRVIEKLKQSIRMQNKGLITVFAIALGLASLYQLSFTWVANNVASDACVRFKKMDDIPFELIQELAQMRRSFLSSTKH